MSTNQENSPAKPLLDQGVKKLLNDLKDPEVSSRTLEESISAIPGLEEALLMRANSPEFALRSQISRLQHAIAILGLRRVEGVVAQLPKASAANVRRPHMLNSKLKSDSSSKVN